MLFISGTGVWGPCHAVSPGLYHKLNENLNVSGAVLVPMFIASVPVSGSTMILWLNVLLLQGRKPAAVVSCSIRTAHRLGAYSVLFSTIHSTAPTNATG